MDVYPPYMFLSYLILISLIIVILPKCTSTLDAFIIGLLTFAVYDSTNLATLSDYSPFIAIVDSIWGGILFATIYAIYH